MDVGTIHYIEGLIRNFVSRQTKRSQALSPLDQLLLALRFYGTGSMQVVLGDANGVCQSSVSRAVTAVTDALVNIAADHISMPTSDMEVRQVTINCWLCM